MLRKGKTDIGRQMRPDSRTGPRAVGHLVLVPLGAEHCILYMNKVCG